MSIIALRSVFRKLPSVVLTKYDPQVLSAGPATCFRRSYYKRGRGRGHAVPNPPNPHAYVERKLGNVSPTTWILENDPKILPPARFTVEEFNKQKNGQLQFSRVVMAAVHSVSHYDIYFLTLEALDAGVVKVFKAKVAVSVTNAEMEILLFRLVTRTDGFLDLLDNKSEPEYDTRDQSNSLIWDKIIRGRSIQIGDLVKDITLTTLDKVPHV